MDEKGRIPLLEAASEGHSKAIAVLFQLGEYGKGNAL
jgi:hypothetical protein